MLYEVITIDSDWNVDESTPDGLKMAHDAEIFSALDELGQQAYNSKDPNKATGQDLDVLCVLTGTFRDEGTASTIDLTLTGVAYTTISAGVRVESTETGVRWTLDSDVTLSAGGTATRITSYNVCYTKLLRIGRYCCGISRIIVATAVASVSPGPTSFVHPPSLRWESSKSRHTRVW